MKRFPSTLAIAVAVSMLTGSLFAAPSGDAKNPVSPALPNAAAKTASMAEWLPRQTLVVLEVAKPDAFMDLLLGTGAGTDRGWQVPPTLTGLVRYLENRFSTDWKTLLRRLANDGLTIRVGPGGAFVAIAQSGDRALLDELNRVFAFATTNAKDGVGQQTYRDVPYWTGAGGSHFYATIGNRLILTNNLAALKAVLDLRTGTPGDSLAADPGYLAAQRATGQDAAVRLLFAPAVVKAMPFLHEKAGESPHPLGMLLLGGYRDAWKESAWLALGAVVQGQNLSLRLAGNAAPLPPNGPTAFAWPTTATEGALPNLTVPRQIAAMSLFRDLRAFYAAKDALFPERTSALILFENMMGIYFSGRDLTEDVMGALDPHVRVVVAEQAYDPQVGTPTIKVPAFALVFRMREPQRFTPIIEEAWQKALGMVSFTRGQKAQPGLIIDKVQHGPVRYSCAGFSAAEERDKTQLDSRFNFRPAVARAGDFLILSSTDQLTNDLIDTLAAQSATPRAGVNSMLELDGARLASILGANREGRIRDNMLKKGNGRLKAETEERTFEFLMRLLGKALITLGAPGGSVVSSAVPVAGVADHGYNLRP